MSVNPPLVAMHADFNDVVRLVVIFVGFLLAMLCVRFAWLAWYRHREKYRVAGILSFGCIVATPAIGALFRFDADINWWSYGTYFIGLLLGFVALYANYHIAPTWARLGGKHSRKERVAAHEQPDPVD